MKRPTPVTYDTVRALARSLPNVEESTSYGTPALKVRGELFVRLREEGDVIVLKMPFALREELMAADPEAYYITEHYRNYLWVLVRLDKVHTDALPELLQTAYRAAMPAKQQRRA